MATKLCMKPRWSLDLTCNDEHDDEPWDFNKADKRSRAMQKLTKDKPFVLIASPMCMAFCRLQELFNCPSRKTEEVEELVSKAMEHLKFAIQMCMMQHEAGRLFIFEHPCTATAWHTQMPRAFANCDGIHKSQFLILRTWHDDPPRRW